MPFLIGDVNLTKRNCCIKQSQHRKISTLVTNNVWADGNLSVDLSSRWIWNFWVPFMPSRATKPCRGTLLVPVTNCKNLARSAWSNDLKARQNHWIWKNYSIQNVSLEFQLVNFYVPLKTFLLWQVIGQDGKVSHIFFWRSILNFHINQKNKNIHIKIQPSLSLQ